MKIRLANIDDLENILKIYFNAKKYMRNCGNLNQWDKGYPSREILLKDINNHSLFVIYDVNELYGVFSFFIGEEETYNLIENGKWLNNNVYGTIHRIASSGDKKGIFKFCLDFCKDKIKNIRIDTHKDNLHMQKLILMYGFKYCGIIYVSDRTPRLAYQLVY